jgi:hypothetical protein
MIFVLLLAPLYEYACGSWSAQAFEELSTVTAIQLKQALEK